MAYFYHIDDLFDFGKFKGLSLSDVMDLEPEYVRWCMFNVSSPSFIIMDEAMEELKMIYPDFLVTVAFERQRMLRNSEEEKRTEAEYIYKDYYDTYERYNGTYAQDVMGYSDDDIDTVFEGDPMAYWNID